MKETPLRDLYLEWICDPNNLDKSMRFIYHWVKHKMPDVGESRLNKFILSLYHHLVMPSFFENKTKIVVNHLMEVARIELEINTIILTKDYNQILKYY